MLIPSVGAGSNAVCCQQWVLVCIRASAQVKRVPASHVFVCRCVSYLITTPQLHDACINVFLLAIAILLYEVKLNEMSQEDNTFIFASCRFVVVNIWLMNSKNEGHFWPTSKSKSKSNIFI